MQQHPVPEEPPSFGCRHASQSCGGAVACVGRGAAEGRAVQQRQWLPRRRRRQQEAVGVWRLVRGHGQPGGPREGADARLVLPLRPHLPTPPLRPLLRRPRPHRLRSFRDGDANAGGIQGAAGRSPRAAGARHELRGGRVRRARHGQLPAQPQRADRPAPGAAAERLRQHGDGGGARRRLRQRLLLRRRQGQQHRRRDRVHPDGGAPSAGAAAAAARRGGDAQGGGDEPAPAGVHAALHPPAQLHRLRPARQHGLRPAQRRAPLRRCRPRPRQPHLPPPRPQRPLRRLRGRRLLREQEVPEPAAAVLRELRPGRLLRPAGRRRQQAVHALRRPRPAFLLGRRPPHAGRLGCRRRHLQGHHPRLPPPLHLTPSILGVVFGLCANQHLPFHWLLLSC